ncbi:hypothetical protein EON80_00790 [bacterium]|nr:MAG: hypothetical protein EON80_00790 [bacterium]
MMPSTHSLSVSSENLRGTFKRCLIGSSFMVAAFLATGVLLFFAIVALCRWFIPGMSERGMLGITSLDYVGWYIILSTILHTTAGLVGGAVAGHKVLSKGKRSVRPLFQIFAAANTGILLCAVLNFPFAVLCCLVFNELGIFLVFGGQLLGQGAGFVWGIRQQKRTQVLDSSLSQDEIEL